MILSEGNNPCLLKFTDDKKIQHESVSVDHDGSVDGIISSCKSSIDKYKKEYSKLPEFLAITKIGQIKIVPVADLSSTDNTGKLSNKIAIVTGGAQGFGGGISEELFKAGANVIIADLNENAGKEKADSLNNQKNSNRTLYVRTDVSDPVSVQNMILQTVKHFGGLDLLISNAGILHAGSLDEMEPEVFNRMTVVNYNAFFFCTKYAAEVLKVQHQHNPDYYTDVIQINSKSGLQGSKKNFAYAGAKFGGIGLTQSFALELVEYKIKVNAICPGNLFEGPLWADPENGLFVQYLKAGKVPGAKTVEDVKKHYEGLVPMNRGCHVEDVMTAIYYIINQKYETGQALPVTGGQIMLR
ncbi:MAG: SDR family NAD(P)-dependent oxidoreductase [Bacteroidales bacterium]|nr:SDR family NAD(P)-dependent oxidoreductase [Bacteroidales bacterium]